MSTSQSELQNGRQYVNFDEFIEYHLQRTRSQLKVTDIATACVLCGLGGLSYLLLFVVADQWLLPGGWPVSARIAMLTAVLGTITWLLVRRVVYPLTHTVNSLYAARAIEKTDPKLKGTLLAAVDLQESGLSQAEQEAVLRAIEKRAALGLQSIDVEQAVDRLPLLRLSYGLLAVVAAACLYVVLSPKDPFVSVRRALLPTAELSVATRTTISDVTPGNQTLPARSMLEVEADVRGRFAGPVQLVYTTADQSFVDQPVEMRRIDEGLPRFRGTITGPNGKGILQNLTWRVEAGDARTADYTLAIVQPPSATVKEIKYVHPPYMQLDPKTTTGGAIDGWEGSQVTLKATTNMPVKSAVLLLFDSEEAFQRSDRGEQIAVSVVKGTELTASWTLALRADGTYARFYRLQVETASGAKDPDPTQFPIKIRPDQPPEVALLHPTSDLERPVNIPLPLAIQASDADFGLRTVTLKSEKNGEGLADIRLFEDRLPAQAIRADYEWDLSRQGFKPGDVVQFWIEVRDSKQPVANRRVTSKLNLRIVPPVSPEAARQQLAADQQAQQDQLAQADPRADADTPGDPMPADQPRRAESPAQPSEPENGARPPAGNDTGDRNPEQKTGENGEKSPAENAGRNGDKEPSGDAGSRDEKRPADDAEALEKFIRKLEEEQQRRNPANQPAAPPGQEKPDAGANGDNGQPQADDAPRAPKGENQPRREAKPSDKPGNEGRGKPQADDGRKPANEQPGRNSGGDNQPSKRNDPAESSDADPADRGKKPTQSRERPGTDDATGSNVPMPSENGEKSSESSSNQTGPRKEGGKPGESSDDSGKPEPGEGAPGRKRDVAPSREGQPREAGAKPAREPGDSRPKDEEGSAPGEKRPGERGSPDRPETGKGAPGEKSPQATPSRDGKKGDEADSPMKSDRNDSAPAGAKPDGTGKKGDSNPTPDKGAGSKSSKNGEKSDNGRPEDRNPGDAPANQKTGAESTDSPRSGDRKLDASRPDARNDRNPGGTPSPEPGKSPGNGEEAKPAGNETQPDQRGKMNDGGVKPENAPANKGPQGADGGKKGGDKPQPPSTGEKGAGEPQPNGRDPSGKKPSSKPGESPDGKGDQPSGDGNPEQNPTGKPPADGRPSDQQPSERGPKPSTDKTPPSNGSPSAPPSNGGEKGSRSEPSSGNAKGSSGKSGSSGSKSGSGQSESSSNEPEGADSGEPGGAPSKSGGETSSDGKPGDGKPNSGKSSDGKSGGQKPGETSDGGKGQKPTSDKSNGSGDKPGSSGESGDMPGENGAGNSSSGNKSGGKPEGTNDSGAPGEASGGSEKGDSGEDGSRPGGKGAGGKSGESTSEQPSEGDAGGDSKRPGGEGQEAASGKGGKEPGKSPNGEGGQQSSGGKSSGSKSGETGGKGGKPGAPGDGPRANPRSEGQTGESQGSDVDRSGDTEGASADNPSGERPEATETLTADEQADAARLDYARKATDLVLNRIKDQIERGEIDQQTLDELGWTKEDLARFADRLQQRKEAAAADDNSPEAVARRMQFEEELKQLRVGGDVRKRSNSEGPARRTTVGNKQAPVPPELRDQYDAYTRGLSKSKSTTKPVPAAPAKPSPSR